MDTKKYDEFDNDEFWDVMRKWSENIVILKYKLHDFIEIWNLERYSVQSKTRFNEN